MKLFITIVMLLCFCYCKAQSPYQFYRLYYDKGLTNSRVNAITQDRQGYMWFGTQDGLNRFDGYTMRTYFADGKNGLTDNRISSLYCDKSGRLWIGTYKGLMQFDYATEIFLPTDTTTETGGAIKNAFINTFRENGDGCLYMATNKAVYRLAAGGSVWEDIGKSLRLGKRFTNISDIVFTSKNLLWVATHHKGFYKIDLEKKQSATFDYKTEFGDSCCYTINTLTAIDKENIVAGMHSYGMAVFNTVANTFRTVPGFLGKSDSIRFNSVSASLTDKEGRVWLGTTYFGLVQYSPQENKVKSFSADAANPFSYSGGAVTTIYEDRQGSIWVGTLQKGVYRFHPGNSVVYFPFEARDANSGEEVRSISPHDSTSVWVGTNNGALLYNWQKNSFSNRQSSSGSLKALPADKITAITKSKDNAVWFATEKSGLIRYDEATNNFRKFSPNTKPHVLPGIGITHLLAVGSEELWLVTARQISRINTKTFYTTNPKTDTAFAPSKIAQVSALLADGENVWIGTYRNSLFQYNITKNELIQHVPMSDAARTGGIIYKMVMCNGKLVCGTVNGLVVYDPLAKKTAQWLQNIPRRHINGLLADSESVWFSNEHTVGKINISSGVVAELHDEVNTHFLPFTGALSMLPNGNILCGTSKGFIVIDPKKFVAPPGSFLPHLTSFRVFDEVQPIVSSQPIKLAYDQNFFSFDVSAFDFLQAANIEYAYRLEGFDKEWRYLGKQRTGNYTNVPGGTYQLKIKARYPSGEWSQNNAAISIHISKAIWQTIWFKLALGLLIAATVYAFYRYRINRIKKEASLRANYEIKLNELENSALRTQMNPHFIFNSLNTINSFISRNETSQAHQYISKFSKLIRYILDHSRQRKILLSDELSVLDLYIQIERIRFENKFDYKIEVERDIDATTIELPPLIIQPFVENAILHGLLPMEGKGFLKICIQHKNDMLVCTVEDNGIGREKAKLLRKDFQVKQKSHGIEITLKRIELFNKEHAKEGTVEIIDLAESGTRVVIPVAWEDSF